MYSLLRISLWVHFSKWFILTTGIFCCPSIWRFLNTSLLLVVMEKHLWLQQIWCVLLFLCFHLLNHTLYEMDILEEKELLVNCNVPLLSFLCFLTLTMMVSYPLKSEFAEFILPFSIPFYYFIAFSFIFMFQLSYLNLVYCILVKVQFYHIQVYILCHPT